MPRTLRVVPPADSTIHLVGDTHIGNISEVRKSLVLSDMERRLVPDVLAHVQLGDFTAAGTAQQDTDAVAFLDAFSSAPIYAVVGNHDIDIATGRTADQAAQAWGMPGKNYAVDLGVARLIVVGPEALTAEDGQTMILSTATLNWLDAQLLAAGSQKCLVACHSPLYETVGLGGPSTQFKSTDTGFYVVGGSRANATTTRDADVRAVLADNANAVAWLSGHTHSPLSAIDLCSVETIGGRAFACINSSALWYVNKEFTGGPANPLNSAFLTVYDDRLEVRWRNHGAGHWTGVPNQGRVITLDI